MTQTVGDWAQRAATLPAALVEATPRAVRAGAEVLEDAARVNVLAATGGDMRLSRVRSGGRRGSRGATAGQISLAVVLRGSGSTTQAVVVPRGPIMLIEGPTRPHPLPFQYGRGRRYAMAGEQLAGGGVARRRRSRGKGAAGSPILKIPGIGYRMNANHPGTRGKRPVRRAFEQHHDEAGRTASLVFATAARRHLGT